MEDFKEVRELVAHTDALLEKLAARIEGISDPHEAWKQINGMFGFMLSHAQQNSNTAYASMASVLVSVHFSQLALCGNRLPDPYVHMIRVKEAMETTSAQSLAQMRKEANAKG